MVTIGAQKLKKFFIAAEQAAISLLSFCIAMAAGRILSPYEYGILTFSLATSLLVGGVHRNVIILPFVADAFSSDRLILSGRLWEAASLMVKIVTAGITVMVLQGIAILLGLEWMKVSSYCVAPIIFSQCAVEFYRRWHMILLHTSTLWIAAISNLIVVGAGSLSVGYLFPSALAFSFAVACGNLAAATICWLEIKPCSAPRFVGSWGLMKDHRRAALIGIFSHIAFSLYAISPPIYVGFALGPKAVAIYSATRLLSTPLTTLGTAVGNVEQIAMSRSFSEGGLKLLIKSVIRTEWLIVAAAVPYIIVACIYGHAANRLIFAGVYDCCYPLSVQWLFVALLAIVAAPLETVLYIAGQHDFLLKSRVFAAAIGVLGLVALTPSFGVSGAVAASGLGWLPICLLSIWKLRRRTSVRTQSGSAPSNGVIQGSCRRSRWISSG